MGNDAGLAFGAALAMALVGMIVAIPISMILRAWLVDGTLEAHFALAALGLVMGLVGVTWAAQGTGWALFCVAMLIGGCVVLPLLGARMNSNAMRGMKEDDLAKYRNAISIDPNNASAHAFLADALMESKQYGEAIAEYETAIALSPRYETWHRKLRRAMQAQSGYTAPTRLRPCRNCGLEATPKQKNCARCQTRI